MNKIRVLSMEYPLNCTLVLSFVTDHDLFVNDKKKIERNSYLSKYLKMFCIIT